MNEVDISEFSDLELFEKINSSCHEDNKLYMLILSDQPPGVHFYYRDAFPAFVFLPNLDGRTRSLLQESYPEFFL